MTPCTVHRFPPHPVGDRGGRIALDIDARQARREYLRFRRRDRLNAYHARMQMVFTFCKAVTP